MDDIEIDVPQYFICPISLQIMKDPVTAVTGITYDRESIEQWLFKDKNATCPVTKQPLPTSSDLTPNHTLRRLIQAWCMENASNGIDRIPTPRPLLNRPTVVRLIRSLQVPGSEVKTLRKLEVLAVENERNRKCMVESGVIKAMKMFIVKCYEKGETLGLEEALSTLFFLRTHSPEAKELLSVSLESQNDKIIESLIWVLGQEIQNYVTIRGHAVLVLKTIIGNANNNILGGLKPEFFERVVSILKQGISQQGINAALQVMLDACVLGKNRIMMVETNAVHELIELELGFPEKRTSELILGVLCHLCSCASGRAQLLSHSAGIAVLTKRLLKVSPSADDRVVSILWAICKFSGTPLVLQEMVRVGTFSKLFTILQVDCEGYLKDKAKDMLRSNSDVWMNSPCMENGTILSKYL